MLFDTDGYVNMWGAGTTLTLDELTDYTFSWWARSSDTGDNHELFTNGGTSLGGFHFNFSGTGNPLLYLNSTNYSYWSGGAITVVQDDGQWHHWLLTYTGTASSNNQAVNSSLYVDGVIQAHGSTNNSTAPSAWGSFRLGRATSTALFSGELNEFAIYNGLLDSSERAALYARGPVGTSLNSAALLNNASYPMTSVSGASSTGIAATSDGSALDACNTTDSLNFVAGRTYRLSLTFATVSGAQPTFAIVDQIAWTVTKTGFGTKVMANGTNTKEWTCTQTGTFVGVWYLASQAGSFVLSDFKIVELGDPLPPNPMSLSNSSDIIAYWRNDGNVTWADRSGNGYTGEVGGSPDDLLFKQGYNGSKSVNTGRDNQGFLLSRQNNGAIGFDGTTTFTDVGSVGGAGTFSNCTISVWVNPRNIVGATDYGRIYDGNYEPSIRQRGPTLQLNGTVAASQTYLFYLGADISNYFSAGNMTAPKGQWTNITMTVTTIGTTLQSVNGYVNLTLEGTGSTTDSAKMWVGDIGNLRIGQGYKTGQRFFVGQIGNLQIWDRVLPLSEITQNFNAQRSRFNV
ncbi:MAG TPA: hypothetical protein EYN67_10735 [Flavobacteriales bacterium]|nr:hypothetical protein [Flavobacteriales bacterium]